MFKGKKTCEVLRAVRKRVADLNGIQYVPVECTHEGDCIGTCPACERERQYVEEQLSLKVKAGQALKVLGVAAGFATMVSCQEAKGQESVRESDSLPSKFEWNFYFQFRSGDISPADYNQVMEMASFVSKFPEDTFLVVGHTDERGGARYTRYKKRLSEVSADYIRSLLVNAGADSQRIKTVGMGPKECVIPNAKTELEHSQNHRITLEFYTPEREKEIREKLESSK